MMHERSKVRDAVDAVPLHRVDIDDEDPVLTTGRQTDQSIRPTPPVPCSTRGLLVAPHCLPLEYSPLRCDFFSGGLFGSGLLTITAGIVAPATTSILQHGVEGGAHDCASCRVTVASQSHSPPSQ